MLGVLLGLGYEYRIIGRYNPIGYDIKGEIWVWGRVKDKDEDKKYDGWGPI